MLTSTFQSFCLMVLYYLYLVRTLECDALLRPKRFLIFPRQAPTRHQFIGGIGIPAELSYESLTTGYVLKAEYWLPFNATVFRENPFFPEYQNVVNSRGREFLKLINQPSHLRWHIYEFLMNRLQRSTCHKELKDNKKKLAKEKNIRFFLNYSFGYNGQECLLKAVCEANAIPFERNLNVFAEIIHILFSPTSSTNAEHLLASNFVEAEKFGRKKGNCNIYACNMSLMNIISHVLQNKV